MPNQPYSQINYTAQLAILLALTSATLAMSVWHFVEDGNHSSAIYTLLAKTNGAEWLAPNFINAFQDNVTGCGVRLFDTLNVTNTTEFFHKKFLGDSLSLLVSGSPVNTFIMKCMEKISKSLIHDVKKYNQPISPPIEFEIGTYIILALGCMGLLIGISVGLWTNRDCILQPLKLLTDKLGLTSDGQAGLVDPEAQLMINTDSRSSSYRAC